MTRIRVLNVLGRLHAAGGGIPTVVRNLIEGSSASIEHHVAQLRPIKDSDAADLPLSTDRLHSLGLTGRWTRSPRTIAGSFRLLELIRSIRPDVVHVHTGSSLIALPGRVLAGKDVAWVVDLHEPMTARHSRLSSRIVSLLARGNARAIAHSEAALVEISASMGIARDQVSLIPLGIDVESFAGVDSDHRWRHDLGVKSSDILAITVGRVSSMKGLEVLINIAQEMRTPQTNRVVFALVGNIQDPEMLADAIDEAGLAGTVIPLGFLDDLPTALAAADIYLTASRYEGFGLSVVEAMASGLPVVASDVGGLTNVVVHELTGFLVPPDDVNAFVESLRLLAADPHLRSTMGDAGRSRVRAEFSQSTMVEAYEAIYREVAKGGLSLTE